MGVGSPEPGGSAFFLLVVLVKVLLSQLDVVSSLLVLDFVNGGVLVTLPVQLHHSAHVVGKLIIVAGLVFVHGQLEFQSCFLVLVKVLLSRSDVHHDQLVPKHFGLVLKNLVLMVFDLELTS